PRWRSSFVFGAPWERTARSAARISAASACPLRFVPRLPLDVAADARHLLPRRAAPLEHRVRRGAQVLSRGRSPRARPRLVELAAVREPEVAVVEEEVRRARRAV